MFFGKEANMLQPLAETDELKNYERSFYHGLYSFLTHVPSSVCACIGFPCAAPIVN